MKKEIPEDLNSEQLELLKNFKKKYKTKKAKKGKLTATELLKIANDKNL